MKKILVCALCFTPFLSFAEVPNTFVSGTPAKASEVNQNFQSLDGAVSVLNTQTATINDNMITLTEKVDLIDWQSKNMGSVLSSEIVKLQGQVTQLEEYVSNLNEGCASPKSFSNPKYSIDNDGGSSVSVVGELLSIIGQPYRVIKVPFVEYASGDIYSIKIPVRESSGVIEPPIFYTMHTDNSTPCSKMSISGYPAAINPLWKRRTFVLNNNGTYKSTSSNRAGYILQIKVNETLISIVFTSATITENNVTVNAGDYDFTDNLNTALMTDASQLVDEINGLVDYTQISPAL